MIEVRNVSKAYGDKQVLSGYSRVFEEGRLQRIEGPSGWGKSTLLRLIMGLEAPDAGEILGVPEKIACVFQEDRLCEPFSALANVCITGASPEAAAECLSFLGLGADVHSKVSSLSGGMKRRVALARALLAESDLLVLDEPFKGLDAENRARAREAIERYAAGKTILLVNHE